VDVPSGMVTAIVHDHNITPAGQVPWQFQREAAGRSVQYLRGVINVANTVTIRPVVSASGIKGAISAVLVRNARLKGKATTVTADAAGAVTLAATARSLAERREAERTAWSAAGVTGVVNHLHV
jgi:osmotically-inducible protein OsmY